MKYEFIWSQLNFKLDQQKYYITKSDGIEFHLQALKIFFASSNFHAWLKANIVNFQENQQAMLKAMSASESNVQSRLDALQTRINDSSASSLDDQPTVSGFQFVQLRPSIFNSLFWYSRSFVSSIASKRKCLWNRK